MICSVHMVCILFTSLKELDVIWAQMEFDHEKHHRTSIPLIFASEEVIETLEDNQVYTLYMYIERSTNVCILQVNDYCVWGFLPLHITFGNL